tara:strand:+ start:8011 stop:8877 length:867 start_codon:yes stop_codon:yes gene_type:complete
VIYPFSLPKEYYGDDFRWFVATVVNSTPPAGFEGRVRIRVYGVHNLYTGDVSEADLPWAQVLIPTTEGGISGLGRISQLSAGSFVFGVFLDGKTSQVPLVLGSFPRIELPSEVQRKDGNREFSFDYDQEKQQNVVAIKIDNDESRTGRSVARRRSQSLRFFIDNGYTPLQSAAITGNLESASNFETYESTDNADAIGIGQWSVLKDNRYNRLIQFGALFGPTQTWKLYSVQLQFVIYELRTTMNLANKKLLQAKTIEEASEAITKYYVRKPLGGATEKSQSAYEEVLA